ncbi:hypothetical protein [Bordetella hinzii]|uniref:hypothetical protein n=1 Tax=Bordetella hinzii TaxID=103855 RepID=UPI000764B66C|nr:hypothetical protein [Bordetella hinzii]KXA71076.1 hypothetical protein AXA74_20450 [Bordetella hinzii LMG 13501]VEH23185.1 Uncharacterised protein [Bordetella hinzii]
MSNNKLAASQRNTVLDDIVAVIGLRATVLLAAWWGGRNIVVPDSRPERSVIARVIGEEAARRLSAAYPAEQIFIPRLNWFEEVRKARQVYNLRARGFAFDEIAQLMVLTKREVEDMAEVGRFAAEAVAMERADRRGPQLFDLELPQVRGGRGGQPSKRASRAAKNGGGA